LRAQHRGSAREAELEQPIASDFTRPSGIGEDARIGFQRNAGVDERAAAEPAADENMNVGAEPEIEQPGGRAGPEPRAIQLKLAATLGEAARELSGEEFLAFSMTQTLGPRAQPRGATPPP
jgi:hypothetical protein